MSKTNEFTFQNDTIKQLVVNGWQLGKPENYNRELALYSEDLLGFIKGTPDEQWHKFCKLYHNVAENEFLECVASQFNKAEPYAANKVLRTFRTMAGVNR